MIKHYTLSLLQVPALLYLRSHLKLIAVIHTLLVHQQHLQTSTGWSFYINHNVYLDLFISIHCYFKLYHHFYLHLRLNFLVYWYIDTLIHIHCWYINNIDTSTDCSFYINNNVYQALFTIILRYFKFFPHFYLHLSSDILVHWYIDCTVL